MAKAKFERAKPHCNTGTIGHVDHGKTTLTAAITGVLHDKYPGLNELSPFDGIDRALEEHQYDITISITHVEYQTKRRHCVHVDCPGRADYAESMVTGAAQMDDMILVVAAIDDPMTQTHEHILLARQVSVPAIIVAFNRCGMVAEEDADLIDLVEMELREILSAQRFDGDNLPTARVATFPVLNGDEKWAGTVLELIDAVDKYIPQPEHDTGESFLTPVEDVLTITGRGTVITGRIERGIVKTGDTVGLVGIRPEKQTTAVTSVEMSRKILNEGRVDESVGLLLHDTKKEDVERGIIVIRPGSTAPHIDFEATVYVLNKKEGGRHRPFFSNYSPQFYFRTIDITGVVQLPEGKEMVMPDDNADMTVRLNKPIAMEESLRFVIREGGRTVGAGKVTKIIK